jgi:hypothetical protein
MLESIAYQLSESDRPTICVGTIVQIGTDGQAMVDFPGNLVGPVEARAVITIPRPGEEEIRDGIDVLLMFENGHEQSPLIIATVQQKICRPKKLATQETLQPRGSTEVLVDGKTIVFDAKDEIQLRCGKSSVTLRKDGKIEIKGTQIVSRASGVNRIKGASVAIN